MDFKYKLNCSNFSKRIETFDCLDPVDITLIYVLFIYFYNFNIYNKQVKGYFINIAQTFEGCTLNVCTCEVENVDDIRLTNLTIKPYSIKVFMSSKNIQNYHFY